MEAFESAPFERKRLMLAQLKKKKAGAELSKAERKQLGRVYRQELVKRSALLKIAMAWLITVPISAFFAVMLFFTIRGMMVPRFIP